MNSRHPNVQLTCEEESNNKISFLDISVTRINNKVTTSLYRKKTFSGVYLNFNSFLPMDYKKGLIHTLLFRPYNICTDYVTLHTENKYHLKLKESLLILKMKPSLNVVKESVPLHLFENSSKFGLRIPA